MAEMQKERSVDRNPNQVTAQVATAPQAPSLPQPRSYTGQQSETLTALQSTVSESRTPNMNDATDENNSGSEVGSRSLDAASPMDTQSYMQIGMQQPSPPETDNGDSSQIQEDLIMDNKSQEDVPPTPISTTTSSDKASPLLQKFDNQSKITKSSYSNSSQIYNKTRSIMIGNTHRTTLVASRGFERGRVPTRRTKPPLLKRRYTIDVNTIDDWIPWDTFQQKEDESRVCTSYPLERVPTSFGLDPLPALSSQVPVPHPGRYAALSTLSQTYPPYNEDVYLELGDATICNSSFCNIGLTDFHYGDPWMRDESLDMALEVLRRETDCENHGIAIANSMMSQICYCARKAEDFRPQEYADYKVRFQDKRWIFIPINDGIGTRQDGGLHWSLVVLDTLYLIIYYVDSLFVNSPAYQELSYEISAGMLRILGQDLDLWNHSPQENSPNQVEHNQDSSDAGPCGPFVIKMTEMLIDHIKFIQSNEEENACSLRILPSFPMIFKAEFHSGRVRHEIQKRIAHWKAIDVARKLRDNHDNQALADTCVELDDSQDIDFEIPPPRRGLLGEHEMYQGSDNAGYDHPHYRDDSSAYRVIDQGDDVISGSYSDNGDSSGASSSGDAEIFRRQSDFQEDDFAIKDANGRIYLNFCDLEKHGESLSGPPRTTNSPAQSSNEDGPSGVTRLA